MTPPAGISGSPAGVWSGEEPGLDQGAPGGGLTRKPEWPLQESPGWKPDALRSAGVAPNASLLWPQFCGGAPPGPGKPAPSPSSRPENAQMELAWAAPRPSPPGGWPLPLISPANAGPAASRTAAAAPAAAAKMVQVRISYPLVVDARDIATIGEVDWIVSSPARSRPQRRVTKPPRAGTAADPDAR